MMQIDTDIKNTLKDDTIFNEINKQFLSLNPDNIKNHNQDLKEIFEKKLIEAMKRESPLFAKTFQRIIWAGSYYKKTRVEKPKEYDVNVVINLPMKEKDLEFISDCQGYIKIRTTSRGTDDFSPYVLDLDLKAHKEIKSFIDEDLYLNQEKIRTWIEGILSKVAYTTSRNNRYIRLDGYEEITIKKSGPAFTLNVCFSSGELVDIDFVPVLAFSIRNPPPRCSQKLSCFQENLQKSNNQYWSAVPKPLNNNKGRFPDVRLYRYWRLCFYDFEKDILSKCGRAKPIIRHLKKLRDTQNWKNVASYYVETLCLHQLHIFEDSNKVSSTYLFFTMLEKLHDAFRNRCIKHYWEDFNLLENMKDDEMKNIENRLSNIIKEIRRSIKDDKFAIAKFVLKDNELKKLKSKRGINNDHATAESNLSSTESFRRCIIT